MVLFINTERFNKNVIPYKKLGDINIIEVSFKNKAILKDNLLDLICTFMDSLTSEDEKFLLIINDIDDAFMNLDNLSEDLKNIKKSMFRSLIETYVQMGHDVIYYTYKEDITNGDVLELDEIDGFSIIKDEVQLYSKLIKDIR